MKKLLCVFLSAVMLVPTLAACNNATGTNIQTSATTEEQELPTPTPVPTPTPTPTPTPEDDNTYYARVTGEMLDEMYEKYWVGDTRTGHFVHIHAGEIISGDLIMIWETSMLMLAMENYYNATGDISTKNRIISEWRYLKKQFSEKQMVSRCGRTPNLAADDTGWDALLYISVYRVTGDKTALRYAKEIVLNAYEYYKDGDIANGMWYCDDKQYDGDQWKSAYSTSFLLVALEYCELTKGTADYSEELYNQTMDLYKWFEKHLRRSGRVTIQNGFIDGRSYTINVNDGLYWVDYNVNRPTRGEYNGPDGGTRPDCIYFMNSVSFLYANMGMAAINAYLYRTTGEKEYYDKAMQTVNSITTVYKTETGTYLQDRDAGDSAAGVYYYVKEILSLPELDPAAKEIFTNTAHAIATAGRKGKVNYSYDWSYEPEHFSENFVHCSNTIGLIAGAAYAQSLGYITVPEK